MANQGKPNQLIHSSSPYLLQHAYNPVNWQEWSEDILVQAKQEDKPIIISIGYSACHWCHVMEHECFENEEIANIMNERYICVKVDREERPDIDQVYMDAVQLLTGRGGWPLNVFTLPDGRPLHGGTYFPPKEWKNVLESLSNFYVNNKEEAYQFATNLTQGIKNLDQFQGSDLNENLYPQVSRLIQLWKAQFDLSNGGYNWVPKFPLPNQWELFMQYHAISGEKTFSDAVFITLNKMFDGGIYDQLGGGFCRYSTDSFWKVPHFEKMLYDNAQLLSTYAMASAYFKEPKFLTAVTGIDQFIKSTLRTKDCAYYSALDADSEGIEGKYYVWSKEEIEDILQDQAELFCTYFDIVEEGNWEGENILLRNNSVEEIATKFNLEPNTLVQTIDNCKRILLMERDKRIAPGLDDKTICSWNALTVKGYANAYRFTQNPAYLNEAVQGADFLLSWCLQDQQLFRILKDGKISVHAFSEDYACLIEALITLFEVSMEEKYLLQANELMQQCVKQFYDKASSLFYFTANNQKVLVSRKIDVNDDVIPSSNSILAKCLYKLSFYFENLPYEEMLSGMQQAIAGKMSKFPNGFSNWMQLILQQETGFTQILLSGPEAKAWIESINKLNLFNALIFEIKESTRIPLFKEKEYSPNQTIAYICHNKTCSLPIKQLDALLMAIEKINERL